MSRTTKPAPARPSTGAAHVEPAPVSSEARPSEEPLHPYGIDLSGVDGAEALRDEVEDAITTAIAVMMGAVAGIPDISPDNAAEVFARIRFSELLGGPLITPHEGVYFITAADVRRRVGMRVSGGKVIDRERFVRHVANGWLGEYIDEYGAMALLN